jgi:hypothetical protein
VTRLVFFALYWLHVNGFMGNQYMRPFATALDGYVDNVRFSMELQNEFRSSSIYLCSKCVLIPSVAQNWVAEPSLVTQPIGFRASHTV